MRVYWGLGVLFLLLTLSEGAIALREGPGGTSTQQDRITVPNKQASAEVTTKEGSTVTVRAGRLSVRVQNRPLKWVLNEILRQSTVVIMNTESVSGQTVSMQLREMPLDQGLRQILKDHDTFFFYGAEEKGSGEGKEPQVTLKTVWIYPKGQGQHPNVKQVAEVALDDPSPEVREQARTILEQLEHPPEQEGIDEGQTTEFNDSAPPTDLEVEGPQGEQEAP